MKPTTVGKTILLYTNYIRIGNTSLSEINSNISKIIHKYDMQDLCVYVIILVY